MVWRRMIKQRFGISAPRVAIRAHVPWYWRWLAIAFIGALAMGAGWSAYEAGIMVPGFMRNDASGALARLNDTIVRQEQELAALRARAIRAERQIEIGSATYADLARQIKSLAEQNATLKEDLAFFQTLMPAGGGTRGIVLERFRLEKDAAPGEYRYRLFLVQTGERERDFEGRLQFVVNLVESGKARALVLPSDGEREAQGFQLKFKFFQRIEGAFRVSPDAAVQSVQVQVYEQGSSAPKLAHTVNAT